MAVTAVLVPLLEQIFPFFLTYCRRCMCTDTHKYAKRNGQDFHFPRRRTNTVFRTHCPFEYELLFGIHHGTVVVHLVVVM